MSDRVLTSFFRETVLTMAATRSRDDKKRFLELCAILLAMDVLPASTVMFVAQDCLATSTIFECELLFSFLEDNMRFFGSCKNTLLIVCTGLIARLSTVLNAGFRGRILLFLARFYPLTDKSGANVIGAFNTDLNFGDVEAELEEEKSRTSTPQVLGTADPMDTDETVETSTKSVPGVYISYVRYGHRETRVLQTLDINTKWRSSEYPALVLVLIISLAADLTIVF
ncbi:hypothetical protein SARC_00772 [Sphaeroforma arctica JP610]|uniref:Uncharacterized protein n=1 Tax=Sphaeroforma arctica JP610 TaxID=667725 RepID=A0A0L0GDZ8_9EUKA|nr:hypothetical protein SARC_00772 [Sphaeroforma arctica JP610]KNC87096.1 hypothetical protein SARC_00772 [Sphaeroforma arctica JP610]|eukprot:XP_014160998.1 hypothetical protein SARC_00772 [Sphaeroforma arctica JP610]